MIWKDIKGYETLYEVSNTGKIRSKDRLARCGKSAMLLYKGKELKGGLSSNGYYTVQLGSESKFKGYLIHRLVAMHFVDGYQIGLEVNHIDWTKTNNHADNLEWVTPSYNTKHGWNKRYKNAI